MMDEGLQDATDNSYQVYLQSFRKHLSSVQEHLDGHVAPDLSDDVESVSEEQDEIWSCDERDRFFHALTIYSRWRPDLIAAAVKTKNVAEVCHYLFMLEESALGEEVEEESRGDGVRRAQRDVAMQVSEEWIAKEEGLAAEVLRREEEMAGQWKEYKRKIETRQKKQEIYSKRQREAQEDKSRKRQRTDREDESTNEDNETDYEMGGDADTLRSKARAWTAEKTLLWRKDDLLERLDIDHMKAIDALLREDVEGIEFPSQEGIEEERDTHTTNHTTAVVDEMIDPTLLAISREASTFTPDPSNDPPFPVPETNNTNPEIANLSPKSRRRYQKRLYMRRKRAQSTGGEVVTEVNRLKPGRKAQTRKNSRQPAETGDDENKETQEAEIQDQDDIRHPNIGGTTRPYRIRAQLDKMGVDAQWLRDNNMGLFHLSSLGKLMSLYSFLEGESEPAGSISAQFIQSLYALVKTFVTIVVYKAIVSREQEGKLKARTKAWRVAPDQIPAASVKHALEIVGVKKRDKKAYFSELQRYACHLSTEEVNDEAEDIDKSDDEDANASDGERPTKPALSLYREVYGPLIRPPSSLSPRLDPVACLSSSYVDDISGGRTRGTTSLSPSSEPEEVLLQEVDEDVLLAVLKEEEEWDKKDQAEEREYEELLWTGMQR